MHDRTSVKRTGSLEQPLKIDLVQVTSPRGTVPTVRIRYAHNSIVYAMVPLAQLPADVQALFS